MRICTRLNGPVWDSLGHQQGRAGSREEGGRQKGEGGVRRSKEEKKMLEKKMKNRSNDLAIRSN